MLLADRVSANLPKSLQQAFNPEIAGSFGARPKLGGPVYHNNIHLCPSHIEQALGLPGTGSVDMLHNAYLWITLTAPEVLGTDDQVISSLPFLPDPSNIIVTFDWQPIIIIILVLIVQQWPTSVRSQQCQMHLDVLS